MSRPKPKPTANGTAAPPASLERFSQLYQRPLPYSLESEMALLGAMILDPRVIPEVAAIVTRRDFYSEAHGAIYAALTAVYDADPGFDLVHVVNAMRDAGTLESAGGVDYLAKLANETPSAAGAQSYSRQVQSYSRLRRLAEVGDRLVYEALHAGPIDQTQEILDAAESAIFELSEQPGRAPDSSSMGELMEQTLDAITSAEGVKPGVSTGFINLDRLLLGLHPSDMVVLAARPSIGKSALAAQLALAAGKAGVPACVFSLEMRRDQLVRRWLATESDVDAERIRSGKLSDDELNRVRAAAEVLGKLPVFVDDSASLTVFSLRAQARRMVARHHVGLIVVDYLQLLTAPDSSRENRQVEVSAISRGIKALARETGVPVLVLSQLNRQSEQREGFRPRMSDLRESGSIEQDADVVMLLHREDFHHKEDPGWAEANPDKVNVGEVIVCKQRDGPVGTVFLTWSPRQVCFRNWAVHREPGQPETPWGELYREGAEEMPPV